MSSEMQALTLLYVNFKRIISYGFEKKKPQKTSANTGKYARISGDTRSIDQAKTKCGTEERQEDRTAVADQTEEDHSQDQDQHHRTQDLKPNVSSEEDRREQMKDQESPKRTCQPMQEVKSRGRR